MLDFPPTFPSSPFRFLWLWKPHQTLSRLFSWWDDIAVFWGANHKWHLQRFNIIWSPCPLGADIYHIIHATSLTTSALKWPSPPWVRTSFMDVPWRSFGVPFRSSAEIIFCSFDSNLPTDKIQGEREIWTKTKMSWLKLEKVSNIGGVSNPDGARKLFRGFHYKATDCQNFTTIIFQVFGICCLVV